MKTERRHDLETNELARRATVWIEKVRPYSAQIAGAVVVLLGLWVVASVWASLSASQDEAAWDAYDLALISSDVEMSNMQRVAHDELYQGTSMQEWASAAWADRQLFLASKQYLYDRTAAEERLNSIKGIYEELAQNASDDQLRSRAHFGLGRVLEMQNKLEEAGEQYDQVRGDLEPLARAFSDRLLTPEAKEAYAWLATAELPRRSTGGIPGGRPAFDALIPDSGDSTGLNMQTLENILNLSDKDSAEDRYQGDSADAEKAEETEQTAEVEDDIFGAPPAETPAEGQPADDTRSDNASDSDAQQP